jgi:hypothetical protein
LKSQKEHIQDLLVITKKRQKECEENFWKFSIRGDEIIIRNYAVKIIAGLEKVGDVVMPFVPQASLPWSLVKQIMQVCFVFLESAFPRLFSYQNVEIRQLLHVYVEVLPKFLVLLQKLWKISRYIMKV